MFKRISLISILVLVNTPLLSLTLQAQTMYRCGSSYQDKPCANGQQGVVIGTAKTSSQSSTTAAPSVDPACKRRGDDAKKIIWMREAGAQKNDLLAKSTSAEQSQLIADIYAVRGNSNDIRANIEKSCMEEKDVGKRLGIVADGDNAQVLRQVQQALQAAEKSAAQSATNKSATASKDMVLEKTQEQMDVPASKKRLPCPNLKNQLEIVKSNLRAGADTQTMQNLNQQKRDLEKEVTLACAQ
ncbi:hypothetical protein [Undibacterium sp.]|uniref:hypothetical protein n=1 Tax=Undibacterium sp. TaxID=1914977 RepID=UPI0037532FDE